MARDAIQDKKQRDLEALLIVLSKSQDYFATPLKLSVVCGLLTETYTPDFRHLYSGIFSCLTQIDKSPELNLEILTQNIKIIYEEIKQHECEDKESCFCDKVIKLYDHVNLDIARMNYMRDIAEKQEQSLDGAVQSLNTKIKESELAIQTSEERVSGFEEKIKESELALQTSEERVSGFEGKLSKAQRDYVAILGIFAAIVITFVASLVFSSSILNNIDKVTIYRLSFVILLLGFVLVNLINKLILFIREMCSPSTENKNNNTINWILLALLIALFVCWVLDVIVVRGKISPMLINWTYKWFGI